ncbi:RNA polymerase sigma factor [Microtetraspora fusca]|uniref:RNA polymerase sigma factor n=1 Tax=Microtetraspora fusca TaxID=1997 RepID=A0ABW6VDA0_MICFU
MPAWPYINRADDRRSLEALRRGDGEAVAGLYDAYADRLADYAHSLLDDQDRAADAVRRAFAAARAGVRRPTAPARLRAWLYALVRLQCAARDRGRAAPVAVLDDPADPGTAALVRDALAELGPGDREILHLSVRHGLTPAETGSVLGLTSRQAAARLARARGRMENAAAAVVLPERGRAHCPDLSALVESAPVGSPGTLLRRRLIKHIAGCERCADGRRRHVSAERLLDAIPIAYPPLSLRPTVLADGVPERPEEQPEEGPEKRPGIRRGVRRADRRGRRRRSEPGHRSGPIRRSGPGRWNRRSRPSGQGAALAALACALVLIGALVVTRWQVAADGVTDLPLAVPAPRPVGDLPGAAPPTPSPTRSPEPDASPGDPARPRRSPAARRTPDSRPPRTPTAARPPVTSPSRSRPAFASPRRAPLLSVSCPGGLGRAGAGAITLYARDAAMAWTATTPEGVVLRPGRGRLRAGASGRITLTVTDPASAGSALVTFHSAGGNPYCRVSWQGAPPSPDTEQTAATDEETE